jgi:hypothetical protein
MDTPITKLLIARYKNSDLKKSSQWLANLFYATNQNEANTLTDYLKYVESANDLCLMDTEKNLKVLLWADTLPKETK